MGVIALLLLFCLLSRLEKVSLFIIVKAGDVGDGDGDGGCGCGGGGCGVGCGCVVAWLLLLVGVVYLL